MHDGEQLMDISLCLGRAKGGGHACLSACVLVEIP
jgi:hypothetical protein